MQEQCVETERKVQLCQGVVDKAKGKALRTSYTAATGTVEPTPTRLLLGLYPGCLRPAECTLAVPAAKLTPGSAGRRFRLLSPVAH
ncbi:hypothetical protein NDU88_002109 [Pleurodeles waltl]|uniref:Uncharacterized protein n=1 Tax=Pleurodeles waltl TaxID=8319 RepID=A0AAV7RER1_PLEWA|nr:hypothetical protein NDU88_002109 [Pleurodeles waltl]